MTLSGIKNKDVRHLLLETEDAVEIKSDFITALRESIDSSLEYFRGVYGYNYHDISEKIMKTLDGYVADGIIQGYEINDYDRNTISFDITRTEELPRVAVEIDLNN